MPRNLIIQLLLLALLLSSCERKDSNFCHQMGRDSGYLPIQTIGEISNDSIDFWLNVTDTVLYYESVFYQIDDQETFNKLVNCNRDDIEINFQENTLLIGYFFSRYGPVRITEQRVNLNCGYFRQNLIHRVFVVYEKPDKILTLIQYNAIIPKLPDGFRASHHADKPKLNTDPN